MDASDIIKGEIHYCVDYDYYIHNGRRTRTLELTLKPRNKRGLSWCNKNIERLKKDLPYKLATSIVNIYLINNVRD